MGTITNEAPEFQKASGRTKGEARIAIESLEVGQWYVENIDVEDDATEEEVETALTRLVGNLRSKTQAVRDERAEEGEAIKFSVKRTADGGVAVGRTA